MRERSAAEVVLLETPFFPALYVQRHFPLMDEDIELYNSVLREFGAVRLLLDEDNTRDIQVSGTVHFNERDHAVAVTRLLTLARTGAGA